MGHIFISYSRNDGNQHATEIEIFLQINGFAIWRDIRNLKPGHDFTADIEKAVESADYVLVCVTPDSKRENSFVRREIQYALIEHEKRGKNHESLPVIPILWDDVTPPHISIVNNEWLLWFKNRKTAENRLLEILSGGVYINKPSDSAESDAFRPYVQYLYRRIVDYLDRAIITREIPLTSQTTSGAVPSRQSDMMDIIFAAKGIQVGDDEPRNFSNFAEAFAYPNFERHVLLLGQPGAGKTITLMAYARDAAAARLDDPRQPLPLLGNIASWDAYTQPSFADWLGRAYSQLTPADVAPEIKTGNILLLLDGLDELGSERPVDPNKSDGEKFDPRRRFLQNIETVVGAHRDAPSSLQILITCRPNDYAQIGQKIALKGAITLQPLDDKQIATYLRDQPELLQVIREDKALHEVAETPLLLSIFAFVYQGMSDEERAALANLKQAGDIRDKIFNAYVDERYKHEERKLSLRDKETLFSLQEVRDILTRLAYRNAVGGQDVTTNVVILYDIVQNVDLERVEKERIEDFIELSLRLNLLALNGEENPGRPTYRFIHLLLRDTLAYPPLVVALGDTNSYFRIRAADALGRIGDVRAVESLLTALQDEENHVRSYAADALGEIGDVRAVDGLRIALQDYRVRDSAAAALRRIESPSLGRQVVATHDKHNISKDVTGALKHMEREDMSLAPSNDEEQRHIATNTGNQRAEATFDELIVALCNNDSSVRSKAAKALGQTRDIRALGALLATLHDSDWAVRSDVTNALGKLGKPAINGLLTALRDKDEFVRRCAVVVLGELGELALDELLIALHDENENMQRSAADALGQIGDVRALEDLKINLQNSEADWSVRFSATNALAKLGEPAIHGLLIALRDSDEYVRNRAIAGLLEIGSFEALIPLELWQREQEKGRNNDI